MSKVKSTSVRCQHCNKWFPSPIGFGDTNSFLTFSLSGNSAQCPYCRSMTDCNKENMRVITVDDEVISGSEAK